VTADARPNQPPSRRLGIARTVGHNFKKVRKLKIIGIHLLTFVTLTIILFLSAETLLNIFASGIHNLGMWLNLIIFGTIGILILTIASCLIFIKRSN